MVKFQARRDPKAALDYFLGDPQLSEEERQGVWLGHGCTPAQLAVGRAVTHEDLAAVFGGRSPTGELLLSKRQPNRRIAWDTVVTPDKSVSVAALCLGMEVCRKIKEAFYEAVEKLFAHMESLAYRQAPRPGAPFIPTGNLLAAQFVHQASRHADPHLHAHLLIMNSTYCADRRWRSVEVSPLYRHQRALKFVLNALLHTALQDRGFGSRIASDGLAKLPVPKSICATYSKAHAAIVGMAREIMTSGNIEEPWTRLPGAALLQRLNERSRPTERPTKPDWGSLLSEAEKAQVETLIVRPAHVAPPPRPVVPTSTPLTILRERWAALGHDRRRLKQLVATTAAEFPTVPLGEFAHSAARLRVDPNAADDGESLSLPVSSNPSEEQAATKSPTVVPGSAVMAPLAAEPQQQQPKRGAPFPTPPTLTKRQVLALMKNAQKAALVRKRIQNQKQRRPGA